MQRRFIQLSFLDRLISGLSPGRSAASKEKKPRKAPGSESRAQHRTKQTPKGPADSPELKALWVQLRREYFPDRADLDDYRVYWSRRNQIRTLASCNLEQKRISVAKELNFPQHHRWLSPLLFHEMCHAYLEYNVSKNKSGKKAWHGKEFRALEALHPLIPELDRWIKEGGWLSAVRSHRAKAAHARRKQQRA